MDTQTAKTETYSVEPVAQDGRMDAERLADALGVAIRVLQAAIREAKTAVPTVQAEE